MLNQQEILFYQVKLRKYYLQVKECLTYPVEILVSNPPSEVKAGMFAEINIATESRKPVIAVPSEAVVVKKEIQLFIL